MNFGYDGKNAHWVHWSTRKSIMVVAAFALNACVTINIYFPAAAAEKAADKVIDEIWQTPPGQSPVPNHSTSPAESSGVAPSVKQESAP